MESSVVNSKAIAKKSLDKKIDFKSPELYINRELSWIRFNS